MTDQELQTQFKRCQAWNDPDQWDALGMMYYQRGYQLNALYCFRQGDACRPVSALYKVKAWVDAHPMLIFLLIILTAVLCGLPMSGRIIV